MSTSRLGSILRYVLRRAPPPTPGEVSDADLLERFTRQRDEAAFELLLWRHGPMVLSLCQRLLPLEQDAEDAFQATFLVLVRKARSISKREALASWLYKVAYRIACRARARASALSNHAEVVAELPATDDQSEVIWRDLRTMLDQEVARLPEGYRRPVVLCYLEGKTNEEAAQLLGWPKGTVATRLARARERLRSAMRRRGWTASSAVLATVLANKALAGALPAELMRASLRSALVYASGQTAAGVLSAHAVALTEGVLRIMWYNKLKMTAGVLLAVVLIGTGIGFGIHQAWGGAEADTSTPAEPATVRAPANPQAAQKADVDRLRREIATLRTELETAVREIKDLKAALRLGNAPPEKGPLYRGRPVVFWLEQAKDGDPAYRKDAIIALGMLAYQNKKLIPELLPPLLSGLKQSDHEVNQAALSHVSALGPQVVPALLEIANDHASVNVRVRAISALGSMGPDAKTAVPALIKSLKGDDLIRRVAVIALGMIGPDAKDAVPLLISALKDKDDELPRLAVEALGGIGPAAKAAIPALMEFFGQRVAEIQKKVDIDRAQKRGLNALSRSEMPIAAIDALVSIDPAIRDLLPREVWERSQIDSWQEIYRTLKKRYGIEM